MAVETPGMYRKDGQIYKVQIAVHGSGKPYAKLLMDTGRVDSDGKPVFKFEFAPGRVRDLRPSDMMTLAEAKEFGALYGVCCVCGRLLTDETSIEAGIGPICAKGGKGANAFDWKVEIYQTDEEREIALAREAAEDLAEVAVKKNNRTITMDANKYGPVFVLRWDYTDPDFAVIKDEVKSWDWQITKRAWNPEMKAWTVDAAKSDEAVAIVSEFASRREFTLSPEAKANTSTVDAAPAPEIEKAIEGLPMTFNDLLKVV